MRFVLLRKLVLAVPLVLVPSLIAAAPDPAVPVMSSQYSDVQAAPGVVQPFVCGTYKNARGQSRWLHHRYQSDRARAERSNAPSLPPSHYIYDDVWVVEDDGSLLLSGVNQFDTDFSTFRFTPNVSGGYDVAEIAFFLDSVSGINLGLGDDQSASVNVPFTFDFYGVGYTQVYVNSNGMLGFGAEPQSGGFFNEFDFFNDVPKVAPFMMDLDPTASGEVRHFPQANKHIFTWFGVQQFGAGNLNTFQVVLHDNGDIDVTYNVLGSASASLPYFPRFGVYPGGVNPPASIISFSNDLPFSGGAGEAIYEEYFNLSNPLVLETALLNLFYQNFTDDYFQIVFFTNFPQTMAGFANELNIMNDVTGIGLPLFDDSGLYGSNGILESRCNMNSINVWSVTSDPTARVHGKGNNFLTIMGQESGHRWGAFMNFVDTMSDTSNLILGRSDAHWSYYVDVDHSSLEGGNWEEQVPGSYICPTQIDYFSQYDHYTFGLRAPEEVAPTFFVSSPTNDLVQNRSVGTPVQFATASGTPVTVTIDDVIAAEGARTPTRDQEEKDLRQAFVLLHTSSNQPTQTELDRVAIFRAAWESYFEKSCDGRLTCNTSITQTFSVASIKGTVRDELTTQILNDVLVESLERDFDQFIPGGGKYFFRYMADENSGSAESVTLIFSKPGYEAESLLVSIDYGTEETHDVSLRQIPSAVDGPQLSLTTALSPNYPNPFNPSTAMTYTLATDGRVSVAVYDSAGRLVRRLVDAYKIAGEHHITWDARDDAGADVASGVYFVRLETRGERHNRKIVLLK